MIGDAIKYVKLQYYRFTLLTGLYFIDTVEMTIIYSFFLLCLFAVLYYQVPWKLSI